MIAHTKDCPSCGRQILTGRDRCIRCEVNKASRLVLGVATAAALVAAAPSPAAPIEAASSAKQRPPGCRHPARPPADCARKHARLDRLGYPKCRRWRCVHKTRRVQFRNWKHKPIPSCTWYGESGAPRPGHGPGSQPFAEWRYTTYHGGSNGPPPSDYSDTAYGKHQFKPQTYLAYAQHGDWSKGDQEEAARRLFVAQGTAPWAAC